MGIVINSCVTGMHGMCLYSYLLCMHTLSTESFLAKWTDNFARPFQTIVISL